ncbi:multiple sugar transport system permease protein [Spirosoma oryzae]|uniref:Multiple sugar transport system permease protein n=1 Tax=Spirosoma oryzae TaxID=1469603 RepID=A0A2T0T8H4_9BACT|nr:carbohydrate ABC transporter permease [Spirosoma oryzae]PRY41957.1 multiple sugar transport system permease protein [Spirosoma oryzae]
MKYFLLALAALTFVYPFIWMLSASLSAESGLGDLTLLPEQFTWNNYVTVFTKIPLGRAFLNSAFVAIITTGLVLITGAMVGYALARYEFVGRDWIFYAIIFTMTLPFQITLIPNYITMVRLGWIDTYLALIVPFSLSSLAVLLFRQAFQSLPQALIDAARIDGAGELRIIFQILVPNVLPTVLTITILTFMGLWNEALWPLIVIRDESTMTMPQLVTLFSVGGRAEGQLGVKIAAAVLLAVPVVILYLFFQKHFIRSMASSGLKD